MYKRQGKIRASFGIAGNEAIGNYDYIYSYSPNSIYDGVGGVIPVSYTHLMGVDTTGMSEAEGVKAAVEAVKALSASINIPQKLHEINVRHHQSDHHLRQG